MLSADIDAWDTHIFTKEEVGVGEWLKPTNRNTSSETMSKWVREKGYFAKLKV